MFEKASRLKIRFDSPKGLLTAEDLWDLPLTGNGRSVANLDQIAVDLARRIKDEAGVTSFVNKTQRASETLQLKFEVVKHVIDVRLAENEAEKAKADAKERKERILEIIARKQDEVLEGKSMKELQRMVAEL